MRFLGVLLLATAAAASGQTLTHGPVTGGVTDSSANIFIRTDVPASVTVRYSTDAALVAYSESAAVTTARAADYTSTFPISVLSPQTTYYLDVAVNGAPQLSPPYPTFTTFPAPGTAQEFKFVVLADFTDVKSLTQPTTAWASAAAEQPAFVFLGGDLDHRNPKYLSSKRTMFKDLYNPNTANMEGFVPLILRQFPIARQWDDHDSGQNNIDYTYPGWNLTQQAFTEYTPTYPLPGVSPAGIWQKFSYAQADFFVLDCRSHRSPDSSPDDANKTMLGAQQLQWLEDGLLSSRATWKIVFTSVVTNPTTKFPDGWSGFETEWVTLRNFIQSHKIANVIFISGDLHLGAIDNGAASGFPEMCVQQPNGIAGRCPTYKYPGTWSEGYATSDCEGYGIITIQQKPDRVLLEAADARGRRLLSYRVPSGAPSHPSPVSNKGETHDE